MDNGSDISDIFSESPDKSCMIIIERFGGYVKSIVINKIGKIASNEDIEECISDVFAALYKYSEKIPCNESELKYLICTIAKRTSVDYFRRLTYKNKNNCSLDEENFSEIPSDSDTERDIEKRIIKTALWQAVEQLDEPDSSIIVYQYFYRKKVHEIAKILSMTSAAVNKRSLRARQKIKNILLSQGYDF